VDCACWSGVKGNRDSLVNGCFDLGKDRCLFCEQVTSLESCDMMNSSCKDFFLWFFSSGVKCWTEVSWVDVVQVLIVCCSPVTEFRGVKYSSLIGDPLVVFVTVRPPCLVEFGDLGVRGSRTRLRRWILKRGRSQKGNRSREASRDNGDDE